MTDVIDVIGVFDLIDMIEFLKCLFLCFYSDSELHSQLGGVDPITFTFVLLYTLSHIIN